jgi:4-methyl-5(b-hydroxyethyl)-thiazole monophosphate biosynthesis
MVYLFLADGFEEIEALSVADILRRAKIEVTVVGIGKNTINGAHSITVTADTDIDNCDFTDVTALILPGGMPGTTNLEESITVWSAANNCVAHGGLLCAICAAPSIIGKAGLLDGKRATCFPGFEEYLVGATVVDKKVVVDGNVITAKGMGCANEFALAIIEHLDGKEKADEIAASIFFN